MSPISEFLGAAGRVFRRVFPERQFYLRSHGQVQFMALSPWTQAGLAFVAILLTGWVGFTSVNVVFQDHIISAKDRKFVRMQAAYEQRIAEIQASYDELAIDMVQAEAQFLATTSDLEAKHKLIADLLKHRLGVRAELDDMRMAVADLADPVRENDAGETRLLLRPAPVAGALRESRTGFAAVPALGPSGASADLAQAADGLLHAEKVALMDDRLERLGGAQEQLINRIEEETDREIKELEGIIQLTGFDPQRLAERIDVEPAAHGGPFIGLTDGLGNFEPEESGTLDRQLFRVATNLDRISALSRSLRMLPISRPVYGVEMTSNYGARTDPFNGKLAFHSGIDFAGPYGTGVHAPMAGTVSHAGWRGAYGRLVEIDHGNGISTRYAHLSRIDVKVGDRVEFRQPIGRIGSSGRSTGAHLHYEVWVDGKVVNPVKFLKAGQYVLEER